MKLSALFMLVSLFAIQANTSFGQGTTISLELENVSVAHFIDAVEARSSFRFVYKLGDVDLDRKVSVHAKNKEVMAILEDIFSGTQTQIKVYSHQIHLIKSGARATSNMGQMAQTTITGIVTDLEGIPLPGATVLVKGTNNGTTTNFEGEYVIKATQGNVLVFSYLGYVTQEITVGGQQTVNVQLKQDAAELEEVVVVAYGTQKKEEITGSVAVVKSAELAQVVTPNVMDGLVGKIAGVNINSFTGQPGDAPNINIRGLHSLNSLTSPLYVIDGIPVEADPLTPNGVLASSDGSSGIKSNLIASINNSDIESISVLKDAAAAALYGSRAANGVVIITTKKGKKGIPTAEINFRTGVVGPAIKNPYITDPGKYYEAYFQIYRDKLRVLRDYSLEDATNYAARNLITDVDGEFGSRYALVYNAFNVPDDQVINPSTGKLNPNASLLWHDTFYNQMIRTPVSTDFYAAVSDGGERTSYRLSVGHSNTEGYVIGSSYERITSNLNLNHQFNDRFNLRGKFSYSRGERDFTEEYGGFNYSPFTLVNKLAPIYPVYAHNLDGSPILDIYGNRVYDWGYGQYQTDPTPPKLRPRNAIRGRNPVASLHNDRRNQTSNNMQATIYADYTFLDDFNLQVNSSAIYEGSRTEVFQYDWPFRRRRLSSDTSIKSEYTSLNFTNQQLLTWQKGLNDHSLELMVGHESNSQDFDESRIQKRRYQFPPNDGQHSGGQVRVPSDVYTKSHEYRVEGYLSRLLYDFDKKYFLNLSYRRDGSSVFHPNHRWGNFFSFGGSWAIGKERLFENTKWLDQLSLKGSFGQQGNDRVTYTPRGGRNYTAHEDQYESIFDEVTETYNLTRTWLGNKNLKWETSHNVNFGIDGRFFDGRLSIGVEYFTQKITDMLFNKRPVPSSGNAYEPVNLGDMINRGAEVSLGIDIIKQKDMNWTFDVNATQVRNEVLKLPPLEGESALGGRVFNTFFLLEEGKSAYDFYLVPFAGIDSEDGSPLYYNVKDPNRGIVNRGDLSGDIEDREFVGKSAEANVFGGFSTDFHFRNLSLNLGFAYQLGGWVLDSEYMDALTKVRVGTTIHKDALRLTWSPDNKNAPYHRIGASYFRESDQLLVKADYLSLQNVRLSYSLPSALLSRIKMNSITFYGSVNNAALWSQRKGLDPRNSFYGHNTSASYGLSRTFSLGLNVKF